MKYKHLKQIASYLQNCKKITKAYRIDDMLICIEFDTELKLVFDLSKQQSSIYLHQNNTILRHYKAPFDNILERRCNNSKIKKVECLKNNRILKFNLFLQGSYKSVSTVFYLEFTGRFTNAILVDEQNNEIIAALRHIDNSNRKISPGTFFVPLEPIEIKEQNVADIDNFQAYFYSEYEKINNLKFSQQKAIKLAYLDKKIASIKENIANLPNKEMLFKQSNTCAFYASLILANLQNINSYDKKVSLTDFEGNLVNIELKDEPKRYANELFSDSKRLRAKANGVLIEYENLNERLSYYECLYKAVLYSKDINELEILVPKKRNKSKNIDRNENLKSFFVGDYKVVLGRNEKENIRVLSMAKKNDIWLHLKDRPSSHVIIKTNKSQIGDDVLEFAGKLCARFSVNNPGKYEIDYTKRENVKIVSGSNVKYINFKTIVVQID